MRGSHLCLDFDVLFPLTPIHPGCNLKNIWPSNQNVVTNIIILNCWKCLWWTNWVGLVGGVCSCQNGVYIFCFDCWCFLFACYCFYMYLCCVFWPVYRCICVVLLGLFAPLLPICCSFGQLAETHTKFLVWDITTNVWKREPKIN